MADQTASWKRALRLEWADEERVRVYAAILLLASLPTVWIFYVAAMKPPGTDFLAFWSAGKAALTGHPGLAYDTHAIVRYQAAFGTDEVYAFVNPPPMFLVVAPLGLVALPVAWWIWNAATFLAFFLGARRLAPGRAMPLAAAPSSIVALWHAQTGLLTSAFQAAACAQIGRRPLVAGLWTGALVVKPHLALLMPVAFLAGRMWRAIAGACLAIVLLLGATWLVFGTEVFRAYPQALGVNRLIMAKIDPDFLLRQSTVFAALRLSGSDALAWAGQALATLACAALVWRSWARPGAIEGKVAVLLAATPLATPYLFNYDLPFLVLPVLWLAERAPLQGLRGWDRPVLLFFYVGPLVARAAALPVGFNFTSPLCIALLAFVARAQSAEAAGGSPVAPCRD